MKMRKIDVLATMGCRLTGDMWGLELRSHSPWKGVGRHALGILTCEGINVPFPFQSVNCVSSRDFRSNLKAGSLRDLSPWTRNKSLFVELVELAFENHHADLFLRRGALAWTFTPSSLICLQEFRQANFCVNTPVWSPSVEESRWVRTERQVRVDREPLRAGRASKELISDDRPDSRK